MARYFVHFPPDGSPAIYWRGRGGFAGETFHYSLNLLAHALGDDPAAGLPGNAVLVPSQAYDFGGGSVQVQPFAYTRPGGDPNRPEAAPIGPGLAAFLDDPLGGEPLDLSLPFYDEQIQLGPTAG